MDLVSILSRTASGYAVKLAALGLAVYMMSAAWGYVARVFSATQGVLG